jgi:hypothetical protein
MIRNEDIMKLSALKQGSLNLAVKTAMVYPSWKTKLLQKNVSKQEV